MWDKKSYYEKDGVLSSKVVSDEEVHEEADKYLSGNGFVESFIVWVEDLEGNLEKNIYRRFLREHIDRFKEEVGYDSFEVDEEELESVRESMKAFYGEIQSFVEEHPIKYKKKEDE